MKISQALREQKKRKRKYMKCSKTQPNAEKRPRFVLLIQNPGLFNIANLTTLARPMAMHIGPN